MSFFSLERCREKNCGVNKKSRQQERSWWELILCPSLFTSVKPSKMWFLPPLIRQWAKLQRGRLNSATRVKQLTGVFVKLSANLLFFLSNLLSLLATTKNLHKYGLLSYYTANPAKGFTRLSTMSLKSKALQFVSRKRNKMWNVNIIAKIAQ